MTLTFIRNADNGFEYMHHFGTGWQELIFSSHADAEKFAAANHCEYRRD